MKFKQAKKTEIFSIRKSQTGFQKFFYQNGFSLLEMVVAIGIFGSVVALAVNIVLLASDAQVRASLLRAVQDNVRFAIQFMNKEIRTGRSVTLHNSDGSACAAASLCDQIRFTNQEGEAVAYCVLQNALVRSKKINGTGGDCTANNFNLTSPDIIVNKVSFYVVGNQLGSSDGQPMITSVMDFEAKNIERQKATTKMQMQTTSTLRLLDF